MEDVVEKIWCAKCGNELTEEQDFCPKCGTKRDEPLVCFCLKCGNKVDASNDFCPKCGNAIKGAGAAKKSFQIPKFVFIIAAAVLLVLAIVIFFVIRGKQVVSISLSATSLELSPNETAELICEIIPYDAKNQAISWTTSDSSIATVSKGVVTSVAEGYCTITATSANGKIAICDIKVEIPIEALLAEGNYKEAYSRADENLKKEIANENLIAQICSEAYPKMKNPDSFKLRDAWYDKSTKQIVVEISGTNSYGGTITSYWYYTYDNGKYGLYTTVSDFEHENYYSWDDTEDILEKLLENSAKDKVKEIVANDRNKISSESVSNINNLYESGKLKDIELLAVNGENSTI